MKKSHSWKFEWDLRKIKDIWLATILWMLAIYTTNTELFNALIWKYFHTDVAAVFIVILWYLVKKFLTDYSNKKWNEDIK